MPGSSHFSFTFCSKHCKCRLFTSPPRLAAVHNYEPCAVAVRRNGRRRGPSADTILPHRAQERDATGIHSGPAKRRIAHGLSALRETLDAHLPYITHDMNRTRVPWSISHKRLALPTPSLASRSLHSALSARSAVLPLSCSPSPSLSLSISLSLSPSLSALSLSLSLFPSSPFHTSPPPLIQTTPSPLCPNARGGGSDRRPPSHLRAKAAVPPRRALRSLLLVQRFDLSRGLQLTHEQGAHEG